MAGRERDRQVDQMSLVATTRACSFESQRVEDFAARASPMTTGSPKRGPGDERAILRQLDRNDPDTAGGDPQADPVADRPEPADDT